MGQTTSVAAPAGKVSRSFGKQRVGLATARGDADGPSAGGAVAGAYPPILPPGLAALVFETFAAMRRPTPVRKVTE